MSDDRWRRIEELYHSALDIASTDRAAWLAAACVDDESLRKEVEALLHYDSDAGRFLEGSALTVATSVIARERRRARAGQRLGGYEVVELLGVGGMGEVYRARDVRLRRDVALKVFENVVSPAAVRRFETEARAASGLNHPNIVTIYGVGESGETAFIAMELVQGRTLRHLMDEGPCAFARALDIALQLADAMAAAHGCGIVHRDLKPENIMITPQGRVKVLDFGIAKLQHDLWTIAEPSATRDSREITEAGVLIGTIGYMSPEQALGRPAVAASDQFSFAVISHEMLTGRRPFGRSTRNETLHAIINETAPPLAELRGDATRLAPVLARCLAKVPGERYVDSADLARDLRRINDDLSHPIAGLTRRRMLLLGGAAAAGAAVTISVWRLLPGGRALQSLAVLPFANPAQDENTEYLCDGITETLIRRLGMLPGFTVIARGTAFAFKGKPVDPRAVGQQLGVEATLSGSVIRRGGRVLISAELVEATSGARLWGTDFDRPAADVLAVQNEIAGAIINEGMHLTLTDEERTRFSRTLTDDPQAYEQFLQAIHHLRLESEDDYLAARELLTRAVARDPKFALAIVTLGSVDAVLAIDGYAPPAASWARSEACVARALALDPDLPDAHAQAASCTFFYRWDAKESQRQWDIALGSRRSEVQSELLTAYALQKWATDGPKVALDIAKAARQADPLNAQPAVREADMLAALGRLDDASTAYEKVIRDTPEDPRPLFGLAEVRRKQERFDEAITVRRRAHAAVGDDSLDAIMNTARGAAGYDEITQAAAAQELVRRKLRAAAGRYVSPLDYARLYAQLGNATETFKYLDGAFDERAPGLMMLKVDPAWDRIRTDARFAQALQRVGL